MDPWIGFLNEEVETRGQRQGPLARQVLRQEVLDRAACSFPFPLAVSFRAVVLGRRRVGAEDLLVLGPATLSGTALDVVGGVLVPCHRDLYPGAVVDARCLLLDPDEYELDEGVLAETAEMDVIVPLER